MAFVKMSSFQLSGGLLGGDFIIALSGGKNAKVRVADLANIIAPFVPNASASGFIPVSGSVLPNIADRENGFTLVGPGIYTQTAGGSITTTETLNILGYDGSTWSLIKAIAIDTKIKDWAAGSYLPTSQVFYKGNVYEASTAIVAADVPGISTKWILKTSIGIDAQLKKKIDGVTGKNLFNKNASGILVNKYLNATGEVLENNLLNVSDYIKVEPGVSYSFRDVNIGGAWGAYYNSQGAYISGFKTTPFIPPAGTDTIRLSYDNRNSNIVQIEKGENPTIYEPYIFSIDLGQIEASNLYKPVPASMK